MEWKPVNQSTIGINQLCLFAVKLPKKNYDIFLGSIGERDGVLVVWDYEGNFCRNINEIDFYAEIEVPK